MAAHLDVATALRARMQTIPALGWIALVTGLGFGTYASSLLDLGYDGMALGTVAVVAIAALVSGIAGFAFSAICGAMLFQFHHDTVAVVQIMLVCSIANQAFSVWTLRRQIRVSALAPFLTTGIFGVAAGVWVLMNLNTHFYVAALGAVLLVYGGVMLFRKPIILQRTGLFGDMLAGFVGGMMGGFAATPGAALSIWCGMKGWDKVTQRAVFQPFILIIQFVALALIAAAHASGASSVGLPPLALACIPASLAGTWWGLTLFRRLSDRHFRMAINLLLVASGAGLLF